MIFTGTGNANKISGVPVQAGTPTNNFGIFYNSTTGKWEYADRAVSPTITGGATASSTLILQSTSGAGTSDAIIFKTGSQLERMRIDSGGNVGIGTPSPSTESTNARLALVGAIGRNASSLATSNTNAVQTFRGDAGSGYLLNIGAVSVDGSPYLQGSVFNGGSSASNLLLQPYGGNVGIGTPSPSYKLQVNGGRSVFLANSEQYAIGVGYSSGVGYWIGTNSANTALLFSEGGGSERMRLESVGNLKIGGTADRATTVGTNQVVIFNGTAPVGTLTNGCSFYSTAGEMRVMDAAGNATLLSPHDSQTNEWIYDSAYTPTGKHLRIDVERLLRFVNNHFGLDCVHDFIQEN